MLHKKILHERMNTTLYNYLSLQWLPIKG